jgi:hypothetical protein
MQQTPNPSKSFTYSWIVAGLVTAAISCGGGGGSAKTQDASAGEGGVSTGGLGGDTTAGSTGDSTGGHSIGGDSTAGAGADGGGRTGGTGGTGGHSTGGSAIGGAAGADHGSGGMGGSATGGSGGSTGGSATGGRGGGTGGSTTTGGRGGSGGSTGGNTTGGMGGSTTTGGRGGSGGSATGGTGGSGGSTGGGGTGGHGGSGGNTGGTGGHAPECPDSSDYVGDAAWTDDLVVTEDALYCAPFSEERTLEQEYATKARLRIAPGTYPLNHGVAGTYDLALPVCFERKPGIAPPTFGGVGKDTVSQNGGGEWVNIAHSFNQPLTSPDSSTWSFRGYIDYVNATGAPTVLPVLDGGLLRTGVSVTDLPGHQILFQLCAGEECSQWDDMEFEACNPTSYPLSRHIVTFEGGQVEFDVRIGGTPGQTMPAAIMAASGTLDGTNFEQTDYFHLVYSATHHHQIRRFAVLFDEPIGEACGLKVLEFDPFYLTAQAATTDCELSTLEEPTVDSVDLEVEK